MSYSSLLGAAGSYFGTPLIGFVGSAIGGILDRGNQPDVENFGPRLTDRKVQVAGYGGSLPIVYGTTQVAGTVIEPKNFQLDETVNVSKEKSSGKGGGGATTTNTTYSYSATFATLLCEGPIVGIRKIWLDAVLVYDISVSATAETIIASNRAVAGIRIYTGTETQEPDSLLEALNGTGNTPAYRGSAYLVFDALQLEKYGNRLPNIRCEVVGSGSKSLANLLAEDLTHTKNYSSNVITNYDGGVYRIWDKIESIGSGEGTITLIDANGVFLGSEPARIKASRVLSQDAFPDARAGYDTEVGGVGTGVDAAFIYTDKTNFLPGTAEFKLVALSWDNTFGGALIKDFAPDLPTDRLLRLVSISEDKRRVLIVVDGLGGDDGLWYMYDDVFDLLSSGTNDFSAQPIGADFIGNTGDIRGSGVTMMENDYTHVWLYFSSCFVLEISGSVLSVKHTSASFDSTAIATQKVTIYAHNSTAMLVGLYATTGGGGTATWSREYLYNTSTALIKDIIDDIEERVDIPSANRDNMLGVDTVDGYMISRLTSARRAIEPLQTAFFFDLIESDYKLKLVKRGGVSAANIPITDMGAVEYGSTSIYPLEQSRQQEIELPKQVVCKYISAARGYEIGTQRSQRIKTMSNEIKVIDLPVVMTDSKAKQVAEVLHFNYWAARNQFNFTLMPKYVYLDPSDNITVTDVTTSHIIRITSMDASIGSVISCQGVADRPAEYVSNSTGADNDANVVTVVEFGPTKAVYGNWPMFANNFDTEAIYIALTGFLSGWRGGTIYRSLDNGANYDQISVSAAASTIGFSTNALAIGVNTTFDYGSTVNVRLHNGTLSSVTQEAVLNGENPMMIGSELIQFMTATLESDGSYTLTNLLRGRKGTEWAMSTHVPGEVVVFIDATIRRPNAVLNIERKYKAVSIGNFLADTYPESVAYTGVNLKPLSPVHLSGSRNGSSDLTISWVRRSRFETTPLWTPKVGEESESYEIDVLNGATVIRTILATSEMATYTAVEQTSDFGSVQATVDVKVHQKSAVVGRGYEASATL